jgi:hypothetical protein
MNRIKGLIILVAVALLVYFITRQVYEPEARSETISSTILLERVRPVLKLITVEGEFNEIYDSRSSASMFEILKSFTPFQKRALLRIKARVSVGYDMESMDLSVDDATPDRVIERESLARNTFHRTPSGLLQHRPRALQLIHCC